MQAFSMQTTANLWRSCWSKLPSALTRHWPLPTGTARACCCASSLPLCLQTSSTLPLSSTAFAASLMELLKLPALVRTWHAGLASPSLSALLTCKAPQVSGCGYPSLSAMSALPLAEGPSSVQHEVVLQVKQIAHPAAHGRSVSTPYQVRRGVSQVAPRIRGAGGSHTLTFWCIQC